MELFDGNNEYNILIGNCLEKLKELPDNSIYTCVTSPPYYGLRDYGTGHWVGGDPNCKHMKPISDTATTGTHVKMRELGIPCASGIYKSVCPDCGAVRVDEQVGLEETPEEYIEKLVEVFREVRRVLKDDGTLWVNIGDSYNGGHSGNHDNWSKKQSTNKGSLDMTHTKSMVKNLKPKDLVGIPWMLAFALRNDGWYLRQDIIWDKRNPMPESVKDRCTKSHEYIFLLSKSPKYYFDKDAIKEESVENRPSELERERVHGYNSKRMLYPDAFFLGDDYTNRETDGDVEISVEDLHDKYAYRNKRDVWRVSPGGGKGIQHFATYPEELITPCILAGCPKGEIVLDPFSGSGTTGLASVHNDRKYIGIELNDEFAQISIDRLKSATAKTKLW